MSSVRLSLSSTQQVNLSVRLSLSLSVSGEDVCVPLEREGREWIVLTLFTVVNGLGSEKKWEKNKEISFCAEGPAAWFDAQAVVVKVLRVVFCCTPMH